MKSILVIRRDNIGDLVCTTPLIHALRTRFPDARIDALVTSYNLPVVSRNPDLDEVFAYTKTHHRVRGSESALGVLWKRARLMYRLRRRHYDCVVLANCGCMPRPVRLARLIQPKHVVGFTEAGKPWARHIDMGIPVERRPEHEVEELFRLLTPLGITDSAGPLVVNADAEATTAAARTLRQQRWSRARPTLAVHISARLPSQRWPAQRFIDTLRTLGGAGDLQFMLFWSPGDENNPMHPGDDGKANEIIAALGADFPMLPWPSNSLDELMAGLSVCDGMLCSDGGAMHLGASLGLPIAALFGKSDATRWHPWGVAHEILQPTSLEVADVTAPEALAALARLRPAIDARARTRGVLK
ncbi:MULTISPECIES: glycosyltransferase family 9 protein [unclassified Niveibacterium]|uniref:glycosyltransferase family 9 protein n=1 Tax=unclassified Niveibacterium TaxID=2648924 RepID=UPI001557E63C|nr:glycosyltransferase family 9 protein [Niveibacterium sp. COAC-50]